MTQLTPVVTVAVTQVLPEPELTPVLLAKIAREIAIGLRPLSEVIQAYNLSDQTYEKIKDHDHFTKLVGLFRQEWHSAANTAVRTQYEAAFTLEQALPLVYARATNGREALNHCVDFLKLLADLGGVKKNPSYSQQHEQFKIIINLGADTKFEFEGSKTPIDQAGGQAIDIDTALIEKEERV